MILAIVGFGGLMVLVALPRGRESARGVGCQKNLMRIGVGLQMYHQAQGHYPTVGTLGGSAVDGPIKAMLDAFAIPDLLEMTDRSTPPKPTGAAPKGGRVRGISCPSDPSAMDDPTASTVSYRANTGDTSDGRGGPFEPARILKMAQVEAADGLSYTAGFAERLVGDGRRGHPSLANYATCPGPIGEGGCPDLPADRWNGDAGSDWSVADWRSTLYNHALTPNRSPSCIADDRKTALMGASSAHPNRVNVLLLDGSVRGVAPTITPAIWRALGTVGL